MLTVDRDGAVRRGLLLLAVPVVVALAAVTLARRGAPLAEAVERVTTRASTTASDATTTASTGTTTTEPPPPPAAPNADPPRFPTTVAVSKIPAITVFDRPDGAPMTVLRSPAPYSGMAQIFTVEPTPDAPAGWLHVALRTRPNGSTGWIRSAEVGLDSHTWSIDINLTRRWATVYDGTEVFASTAVVIGTDASPTPVGDYFVTEGVWTGQNGGAYGPFIYGLSAHSDVYTEFAGGDGQIGLHGTNQPQLLGTPASHGCVRFPNDIIRNMANTLPMGVPVHIHA
jgi:lipoprotein-anchoring transpeptidase ErfK/SrfK